MVTVPGFLPSTRGLPFSNVWPHVPPWKIEVLGRSIPLADAANGLCAGMTYAVRDLFERDLPPPAVAEAPGSGPLFEYIAQRMLDSMGLLEVPALPIVYLHWMSPRVPDNESLWTRLRLLPPSRMREMLERQWPQVQRDIDDGRLSPLALIAVRSLDPFQLGRNHAVLAYGYERAADEVAIAIYDPNHPGRDDLRLRLYLGDDPARKRISYSEMPVICFVRQPYRFSDPAPIV
jgi:hypothetical protein